MVALTGVHAGPLMSRDNPLWGAPRIHGEVLKLGIEIAAKYMVQRRRPPRRRNSGGPRPIGRRRGLMVRLRAAWRGNPARLRAAWRSK